MPRKKSLEGLARFALRMEEIQETLDSVRDFVRRATVAHRASDGRDFADAATDTEVVGIDHFAARFDFLAFDPDIRNPVLAAGVRAARDVQSEFVLVIGETIFGLFRAPAGVRLSCSECKFAEFGASAGDGAAHECGRSDRQPASGKIGNDGGDMDLGDVDEEEILHERVTNVAVTVALRKIGGEGELRRGDAAANDGSAYREGPGLFLRDYAQMVAMDVDRRAFGLRGIERKIEPGLESGEEGSGGPAVFEKKIF